MLNPLCIVRRKILVLIYLACLACSANGQDIPVANLFTDAVRSLHDSSEIAYLDSSISFYTQLSRFADKKSKVTGQVSLREYKKTSIQLTKAELKEADSKMRRMHRIQWPAELFPGSRRLTEDSIAGFISYLYTRDFNQNPPKYRHYYYFSQPVFIRSGSIAIFRVAAMIMYSAGNDYLFIYEKGKNGWEKKMIIVSGAW
jgi:hypothetical protein